MAGCCLMLPGAPSNTHLPLPGLAPPSPASSDVPAAAPADAPAPAPAPAAPAAVPAPPSASPCRVGGWVEGANRAWRGAHTRRVQGRAARCSAQSQLCRASGELSSQPACHPQLHTQRAHMHACTLAHMHNYTAPQHRTWSLAGDSTLSPPNPMSSRAGVGSPRGPTLVDVSHTAPSPGAANSKPSGGAHTGAGDRLQQRRKSHGK
jgi:hypothetical protein